MIDAPIIITMDDLTQFARDLARFTESKALILIYLRAAERGVVTLAPTIQNIASALDMMEQDVIDDVEDLIRLRRLRWSVVSPDRIKSRVRVA